MTEMRWAARYTFCDSLWRGRARLIVDPELEAVLRRLVDEPISHAELRRPWHELLDALVPRERGVPVWMLVRGDELARTLAPHWPGTRFISLVAAEDLLSRAPWELAIVHLAEGPDDRPTEALGSMVTRVEPSPSAALRRAGELLGELAGAVERGRQVLVSSSGDAVDYDAFSQLVEERLPGARIYGAFKPAMVAFVEFFDDGDDDDGGEGDDDGEPIPFEDEDDPLEGAVTASRGNGVAAHDEDDVRTDVLVGGWDTDDDEYEDDEDGEEHELVPLSFDNTLADGDPVFTTWIALAVEGVSLAEGLTLVELPSEQEAEPATGALRRQLHETRRLADLGALERQRQVERIDGLLADNAALREALAQLREQLAGALDPSAAAERLDAALAREQSLRWRVAALERELAELRVRPVDELEAELERVHAELDAARSTVVPPALPEPPPHGDGRAPAGGPPLFAAGGHRPAAPDAARRIVAVHAASGRTAALRHVEGLVRRIDRGKLVTGALRRELVALRKRLRS